MDINGIIRIDFDKIGLKNNKDLEGTFSLEAEISGSNGTRRIEVNPYSEIGIQRVPVGIKSEPPFEISKKLLNMILELKDADSLYDTLSRFKQFINYDDWLFRQQSEQEYNRLISVKDTKNLNFDSLKNSALDFEFSIAQRNIYYYYDTSFNKNLNKVSLSTDVTSLKKYLQADWDWYSTQYKSDINSMRDIYEPTIKYDKEKINIVLEYLEAFEEGGEDATKAFLSLLNKDIVSYNNIKSKLTTAQKTLADINLNYRDGDPKFDSVLLINKAKIDESLKYLVTLAQYKGSTLEYIINKSLPGNLNPYDTSRSYKSIIRKQQLNLIYSELHKISEALSQEAGKIIYKKLVYATIDLGKSGARSGEVLNIYVTWILDSKKDSLSNSPRLPIGKYYLAETGWNISVTDMFALVKRIHENKVDQMTVSPSNFKGSGGAVLNWTYYREDHGLKLSSKGEYIKTNKFLNFWEPSIGLNISYLDFSTEKDVEIGTGLQLGLFRNKIFVGYGVNLHMLSPKNQAPTYWYIGFSFAKLSDLFKNSNSVAAVQ